MSSPSKKSTSWFARLGSIGRKRRSPSLSKNRRGLRFESLENRSLLSATVLPSIDGIVYHDATNNGLTSDDSRLANVTVNLFRDGGNGVFEGKNAGSDDTQVGMAVSDISGKYKFDNLSTGTYFVQEVGVPGLVIAPGQNVQKVVVTNSDLQGTTTGTVIDSFSSTSQYVSGSLHGGKIGMSSQSAQDAIGGHRNLYVQLTSAKGSVSLGANSDFPGMLDVASGSASNGIFWVNWDGGNSNASVLNPTGLGQVDITSQGASTGIKLTVAADHDNGFIMLKVFSDASNWSWTSVPISNTADGSLNDSQFAAFSAFTVGGGTGADFSKVGAIQLAINGVNANDGQVGPIQAAGPKVFSENFANLAQADLAVVKSALPSPAVAGNQLTYTFTTTNNGVSDATGVTLADVLPAGVHYVSSSSSQGMVTTNNGTLSVQLGSLAAGASATTNIVFTVDPSAAGSITNTVTVTGNEPDPNLLNNSSTVTTQINRSVDLAIIKTAAPSPVKAGKQLTYTLTATNNGPSNATGVSIVDTLPAGTSYYSASGQSSATIADHTLTLNVGNLAAGASSTIVVVVDVASTTSGAITNTAVVSGNEPDPNLANNTASVSTQIDVPVKPLAITDLQIVKSASPSPVTVGSNLTYTLIVSNNSLTTATGVTVVDTLPTGFAYVSVSAASGQISATSSGNKLTLNLLASLASQASDTITIVGYVTAAAASSITNTAVVSSHEPDANEADNTSSVATIVVRPIVPPPTKYHALGR